MAPAVWFDSCLLAATDLPGARRLSLIIPTARGLRSTIVRRLRSAVACTGMVCVRVCVRACVRACVHVNGGVGGGSGLQARPCLLLRVCVGAGVGWVLWCRCYEQRPTVRMVPMPMPRTSLRHFSQTSSMCVT